MKKKQFSAYSSFYYLIFHHPSVFLDNVAFSKVFVHETWGKKDIKMKAKLWSVLCKRIKSSFISDKVSKNKKYYLSKVFLREYEIKRDKTIIKLNLWSIFFKQIYSSFTCSERSEKEYIYFLYRTCYVTILAKLISQLTCYVTISPSAKCARHPKMSTLVTTNQVC